MLSILAKEAAANTDLVENYNRIPKSVVRTKLAKNSIRTWQDQWDTTTKGPKRTLRFNGKSESQAKLTVHFSPNFVLH
jgi:hypothetical protein